MALSDNVFSLKNKFLYKNLWKCHENFKIDEINLFNKKIQWSQSLLNESQKDIIIAASVTIFGAILYYIFSFVSIGPWSDGSTGIFIGEDEKKQMMNVVRNNGLLRGKLLSQTNFHCILLLSIRLKQINLFDVTEYTENLKF